MFLRYKKVNINFTQLNIKTKKSKMFCFCLFRTKILIENQIKFEENYFPFEFKIGIMQVKKFPISNIAKRY